MKQPVKVFFCEQIGDGIATATYTCECGREIRKERRCTEAEWKVREVRDRSADLTCKCGKVATWNGSGFHRIFRRVDTGEELGGFASKLPPGACYDATWYHEWRTGPDGRALVVILPNGHGWFIDGEASNCTKKGDKEHRCWCRHGRPEDGTLHVDKNGNTCSAGAGSIQSGGYHGFLRNGHLEEC
jgi:hypothetical protein